MTGCGGDPPNKEIEQARQAIETARASGAPQYAADDFTAAESALKRSQAAVVARDYRQALNDALDARDRAQTSAKDAADKKTAARTDVDRELHDAALAIIDARAKLRAAEGARRPRALLVPVRREIADAELHVQEASALFEKGEYLDAGTLLQKTMASLRDRVGTLNGGTPQIVHRRK
jgi:flagellar hook-basal body complex protein FliE